MTIKTLLGATALATTIFCAPLAQAQTDTSAAQDDSASVASSMSAPAAAEGDDDILVTGSRIRRAGFETLEPATVVSSQYLEARGLTNIADALNEIPGFGVGVTPEGNRGGSASARTSSTASGLARRVRSYSSTAAVSSREH